MDPVRIAIYMRVSTSNQSVENQRHELHKVAAARHWHVANEYTDDGISGAKGRSERPALDALLKAAVRSEFDLVAVWALDRLGRSLEHLVATVNELQSLGIDLYSHKQALDTSTPAGRLAFQVFGALSEYERALLGERVKAGIERARRNGTRLGRPTNLNASVRAAIIALRAKDHPIRKIAAQLKVGTGTVYRVIADAA